MRGILHKLGAVRGWKETVSPTGRRAPLPPSVSCTAIRRERRWSVVSSPLVFGDVRLSSADAARLKCPRRKAADYREQEGWALEPFVPTEPTGAGATALVMQARRQTPDELAGAEAMARAAK